MTTFIVSSLPPPSIRLHSHTHWEPFYLVFLFFFGCCFSWDLLFVPMFLKWTLYSCYFLLTLILVSIFSNQLMKTVFNLVSSNILICKINKPLLIFMSFLPENLLSCFPTSHSLWLRNPAHSLITLGRPSPSLLWVPLFNDYSCSSCLWASYWFVCLFV